MESYWRWAVHRHPFDLVTDLRNHSFFNQGSDLWSQMDPHMVIAGFCGFQHKSILSCIDIELLERMIFGYNFVSTYYVYRQRIVQSFFFTTTSGEAHGLMLGFNKLSNSFSTDFNKCPTYLLRARQRLSFCFYKGYIVVFRVPGRLDHWFQFQYINTYVS